MITTTKWRPDTCDCEIDYEWDTESDPKTRVHTVKEMVKTCKHHEKLKSKEEKYNKVLDENQTKNKVHGKMLEIASITEEVTDEEGNKTKKLKAGKKYDWSFDENRKLVVDLSSFENLEKDEIKDIINLEFPNKVKFK